MHSIFFPFVCNLQQTDITEYFPLSGLDIFFTLAQSDTVESEANGRNSNPWTFLFQRFTIFNVTNPPRRNVCIQTMDWRNFIIVQNSEDLYIFRSRAWKRSRSRHHVSCLRCLPLIGAGAFSFDRGKSSEPAADPQRARQRFCSDQDQHCDSVSTLYQLLPDVLWHHPVTLWPGFIMSQLVTSLLLLWVTGSVTSFNLDPDTGVVYTGQPGSLFGFSVAAHRDRNKGWWVSSE